ncbi:MAG: hypothetical protein IKK82_03820 [Kiritimatiellae bacterium]|nr:hypothetical protein [Kiritimatiellia bacterium]
MKPANFFSVISAAICLHASAGQLFESETYIFSADTTGSEIVVTAATDGVSLWCRAGEKITAVETFSLVTMMPVVSASHRGMRSIFQRRAFLLSIPLNQVLTAVCDGGYP